MPMVKRGTGEFTKLRLLISGFSNSGKTHSIQSFAEEGKSLVIIVCPGETGIRSLPEDSDTISSYYSVMDNEKDVHSVEWSEEAVHDFNTIYKEVRKNKPDKLFIDGVHNLYHHNFNIITGGEYLAGVDMNVHPTTGRTDPYRSSRFYASAHNNFGQYLAGWYASEIPFVGVTVLEDWQTARTESDRAGGIEAVRYLWPYLPGSMALNVVQRFDARLSAKLRLRCIHGSCEKSQESELHHVWQFFPKDEVMGVGIKGLKVTRAMEKAPWIHQTWSALQNLMKRV